MSRNLEVEIERCLGLALNLKSRFAEDRILMNISYNDNFEWHRISEIIEASLMNLNPNFLILGQDINTETTNENTLLIESSIADGLMADDMIISLYKQPTQTEEAIPADSVRESICNSNAKLTVVNRGAGGVIVIVLIVIGILGLALYLLRHRLPFKNIKPIEIQEFIPRKSGSASKDIENENDLSSVGQLNKGAKRRKSDKSDKRDGPEFKLQLVSNSSKKEEEHKDISLDNENIFTNLDNSPQSVDDTSRSSIRGETPKNIDFKIEFSMINDSSKLQTVRSDVDQDEN